ncbi:hypothetical protein [Herbaspirillum huttiense]|uniref:hypothetical protein n=1 Tax=Herbaspirillum huttiense TaxID=863372 RepID=UPI0031DBCF4F
MGLLGKRFGIECLKGAVSIAQDKISNATDTLKESASEVAGKVSDIGQAASQKVVDVSESVSDSVRQFSIGETRDLAHEKITGLIASAKEESKNISDAIEQWGASTAESIRQFDFDEAKDSTINTAKHSVKSLRQYVHSTFEIDKSTSDMVEDIRKRLPVPARTVDEIYDQCRKEALRRAIAAFMLGDILDQQSQAKYDKLSDTYDTFRKTREKITGDSHPNYDAKKPGATKDVGKVFENDYNPDQPLRYEPGRGTQVTVDHVTSKHEIFQSFLLKAGLTDVELGNVMNDQRNLVYAHRSVNSQKNTDDLYDWLDKFGEPYIVDGKVVEGKIKVTIQSTKAEHVLDKKALDEAYAKSKQAVRNGQLKAIKGIATTAMVTGASMAAQQVVGLILVETIDIFMDELKKLKILSREGWIDELKESKERITTQLNARFEERQIWSRAKTLGIEAGLSGALSVIPQILISLILKMPAFAYALIRESTLSVVRCVRILASDDAEKLEAIQIILLGAASAIAGVYVHRVISQGVASVPLLNRFNPEISSILSGMLVTAIPLAAIYTFEQNKNSFILKIKPAALGSV